MRALRRHSLRRDATSRNCANKPNRPDADAKTTPTTAGRCEHFDDIPFGETRRQETAPINRTRRIGRQKVPYDRWPMRALRRHSLRRDATSRNCANKPNRPDADAKTTPTTAGRCEHFDDIPFGETRRQETAPINRTRRIGRQKVPYDRWPMRAL
ncbi:hypothetical protein ISCGN_002603 [Ixodes scapularis]